MLWVNQSVTVHWKPVDVAVFGSLFGSPETLYPWRPTWTGLHEVSGVKGRLAGRRRYEIARYEIARSQKAIPPRAAFDGTNSPPPRFGGTHSTFAVTGQALQIFM
ncbi:hypothetical protein ACFC18_49885 [Streptomyces sp. NPDC056121]|uniref:hypothetical protein n=1 Tax=Streptomyces sp. NPDC056121 TaxID=3345718 RepID=UPI0035E1A07E